MRTPVRAGVTPLPRRQGPLPWQTPPSADVQDPPDPAVDGSSAPSSFGPAPARQGAQRRAKAVAAQPGPASSPPTTGHVLQLASKLSLSDLRRLCESQGLPAYGTKAQLANRLVAQQKAEAQRQQQQ